MISQTPNSHSSEASLLTVRRDEQNSLTIESVNSAIVEILSTLVSQLSQHYQERLDQVVLFGSHARGEATSDSDIDILVVLEEPVDASVELRQTSQLIAQLCLDNNVLISRLFLSRSRYEAEHSPLLKNIRREGIVL